jgi:hypothetical protein
MARHKVKHLSLFVRLRGGCFHEKGWTLSAPENFENVAFVAHDAQGKVASIEYPPWAKHADAEQAFAQLKPYADPERAKAYLNVMCAALGEARAGNEQQMMFFGVAWLGMIEKGIRMSDLRSEDAVAAYCNVFGQGRVMEHLNKGRRLDSLAEEIDPLLLVAEALDVPEPIGCELV